MTQDNERILTRDCQSTIVPAGDKINLPAGTKVTITHRLGNNFTIACEYGMFRISGKDADAIGEEIPTTTPQPSEIDHKGPPSEDKIWEHLKQVFDPEIPVNIVDLGLIYSMDISKLDDEQYRVDVAMTLTAPGCGMGPSIAEDAKQNLLAVPGVHAANVELVWDPPWHQEMISEAGKMQMGLI